MHTSTSPSPGADAVIIRMHTILSPLCGGSSSARLCENVLGDPLTDPKRSFGWSLSPFEHKKGRKNCSRMDLWPHRFDFSHSLAPCWAATDWRITLPMRLVLFR